MLRFRRSRLVRTVVIPLVLVSFLAGCWSWRTGGLATLTSGTPPPDRIRVTTVDGVEYELHWPVFSDSTFTGWSARDTTGLTERSVFTYEEIQELQTRHYRYWIPIVIVATIGLAFIAFATSDGLFDWDWGETEILPPK